MGLGYALMEEVILKNGTIQNLSLQDFLIPTTLDVPDVKPIYSGDEDQVRALRGQGYGGNAEYSRSSGDRQCHRPCLRRKGSIFARKSGKGLLGDPGDRRASGQMSRFFAPIFPFPFRRANGKMPDWR